MPKGVSGNPKGAPEKQETMAYLIRQAALHDAKKEEVRKRKTGVVNKMYEEAERGNVKAMELIMKYHDGIPTQQHEHEGEININVIKHGDNDNITTRVAN